MLRARTRARSGGLKWFNSSALKADGISPTLAMDFQNNRYASNGAARALENIIPYSRSSTATYVGSDGLIKTAATNELRYAYDPETLAFKGAMFEPSTTNIIRYSQDMTNALWLTASDIVSVTGNYDVAPDGTTTSNLITEGSAGTANFRQLGTIVAGSTNTWSIWFKYENQQWIRFFIYDNASTGDQIRVWVDLINKTTGLTEFGGAASGAASRIKIYPNGWVRISVTGVLNGTGVTASCSIASAAANTSYIRVSGAKYQAWGAQLESNPFMSSYIPTTSASVTRSSDISNAGMTFFQTRTTTGSYKSYDGTLNTALIDEVRYNYSAPFPSISASKLTEPSATNSVWANVYTAANTAVVKNNATGPDNVANSADTFTATAATLPHYAYGASTACILNELYTVSEFVKYVSGPVYCQIATSASMSSANTYSNFDLSNGTVAGNGSDVVSSGIEPYRDGWYRIWMTWRTTGVGIGAGVIIGSVDSPSTARLAASAGNGVLLLYGMQYEQGTAPSSYIPTTTSAATRTADIVEPQSSNLLKVTHQLTNSAWFKNGCSVTDGQTDPYGTTLACLVTDSAAVDSYVLQTYTTTSHANKTFTFSVWLKTGTKTGNINLQIKDSVSTLVTQAVTPTATWTKYSVTGTFGASPAANVVVVINPIDTTAGDYYVFGPQLEEGSVASPVMIVSDSGNHNTAGGYNWINPWAGTMMIEADYETGAGTSYPMFLRFDDTTSNNRINIYYNTGSNLIGGDAQLSGSQFIFSSPKNTERDDILKFGISYRTNNARGADEGTLLGVEDPVCSIPKVWVTKTGSAPFYITMFIKQIRYYPLRVSDPELQRITTL
jgi:hypothetical protein